MNSKSYLADITYYLSVLRYNVEHNNAINLYDINIISENFYNQLLNMVYGYKLQNINIVEKNAKAIDLGDVENRIAVQITSDSSSSKIKKTIQKFLDNKYYEKYDRLIMLLITDKLKYRKPFETDNKFIFDISKDIISIDDIMKELNGKESSVLKEIANFLKNELSPESLNSSNKTIDVNQIQERKKIYLENLKQVYNKEVKSIFLDREFKDDKTNIDIDEIVKSNQNFLILGEPGAGKTYCINRILHEILNLNDVNTIPVYIKLSGYGYSYKTIKDMIFSILSTDLIVTDQNDVDALLRTGKLILLLDGLDEVRDEYYEDCLSELKDKMNYNPLNKYIISCRENVYFNELDNFLKKLQLQNLTKSQILEYLRTFCNIHFSNISENQYELFKNPLLLNIAIEVINENEGIIPLNRSKMFNKYTEYLCNTWGKLKGLTRKQELSYIEILLFLSKIAFNSFEKPTLSLIDIQSLIKKEFDGKNITDICNQILNLGILKYKSDNEIYFVHKTFKEYLAGVFIVGVIEEKEELNILEKIINKKQYHEVIIFASGLINNWTIQNEFLDFIFEENLSLYIECIKGKNDINDYLLTLDTDDYSNLYMNILVNSYEKMINKYFPQIKNLFVPFKYCNDKYDYTEAAIIGQLSEDRRNIYYSYVLRDTNEKKVINTLPEKIREYHLDNSKSYQISIINLELSNLMGDSARMIAIRDIKSNLSSILKEYLLNEDDILNCERVSEMKKKLPIKENDDLSFILQWTKKEIETTISSIVDDLGTDSYNGIDLFKFYNLVENLINKNIDYNNYLLPKENNFEVKRGWVWNFYTKNQILKRIELFFHYSQTSFINLVENNFANVKMYMPDYTHLPYKYMVEVEFKDDSITDSSSQPSISYYYIACDLNESCYPIVNVVEKISDWDYKTDIIQKSFKHKTRFTNNYSIRRTGVTMTIHDQRTGSQLPILSNVYKLIQDNLEKIFGKF